MPYSCIFNDSTYTHPQWIFSYRFYGLTRPFIASITVVNRVPSSSQLVFVQRADHARYTKNIYVCAHIQQLFSCFSYLFRFSLPKKFSIFFPLHNNFFSPYTPSSIPNSNYSFIKSTREWTYSKVERELACMFLSFFF